MHARPGTVLADRRRHRARRERRAGAGSIQIGALCKVYWATYP